MKKFVTMLFATVLVLHAKIIQVPADHAAVQAAINASADGDTVVVSPGTYYENINFKGKKIVVTSRFYESHDLQFIYSTVLNGSLPNHPDTASVVLFISNEDSSAVIQGFTITGGKGTAWPDEHSPGTFVEGGGILSALASPKIMYNLIINNEAIVKKPGITSSGGGGIRCGDGNPYIANNVIMNNQGRYGGGVVLNYCGAVFRNNVVVGNWGGQDFGGGGVWLNGPGPKPKYLENNTIIGNNSSSDGGGVLLLDESATAIVRNTIIWGNSAASSPQISGRSGAVLDISYSDVQGGWTGAENVDLLPMFADSTLYLLAGSQLIDKGDPSEWYNDQNNGTTALFPSLGAKRNDIGAYGGPFASLLPMVSLSKFAASNTGLSFGKTTPDTTLVSRFLVYNNGTKSLSIDSVRFTKNSDGALSFVHTPQVLGVAARDSVAVQWQPTTTHTLADTVLIYHNDTSSVSPVRVFLSGQSFLITAIAAGTMYSGSGTTDSAKLYTVDTLAGTLTFKGKTDYSQFLSMRINPKTNELVALVNSAAPQLVRISSSTGESFPLASVTITNPKGMAFTSDGTLLIGSFTGSIYSVDMKSGASVPVAATGLKIAGLAFNPVTGTLWASVRPPSSGKDRIYTINPATGASTLIGSTGFGIATKDITFDASGRLFGVLDTAGSQSYLIRIDTVNAHGTVVGGMTAKGIEAIELSSHYITAVRQSGSAAPSEWYLAQNYPNPFNPATTIAFSIPARMHVSLKVYDMLGREVATIVNGQLEAGMHRSIFNAGRLASGVYIYTLAAGNFTQSKKLAVIK